MGRKSLFRLAAFALLGAAALTASGAGARNPNPRVLPPQAHPFGQSYAQWTAAWWQWALGLPREHHPLFDETGADAAAGQSGQVWFLGSVFNASGTTTREITVPPGTALFFPVINFLWVSTEPSDPQTAEAIRPILGPPADAVSGLAVEVDGVPLEGLAGYRTESPLFDVDLPAGNIFGLDGCPCSFSPAMDAGYYVMLAPLSAGRHTLHFRGALPVNLPPYWSAFSLDITYRITVGR